MADRRVFFFKSHIQWRSKKTNEKEDVKPGPDQTVDQGAVDADKDSKGDGKSDDQGRVD